MVWHRSISPPFVMAETTNSTKKECFGSNLQRNNKGFRLRTEKCSIVVLLRTEGSGKKTWTGELALAKYGPHLAQHKLYAYSEIQVVIVVVQRRKKKKEKTVCKMLLCFQIRIKHIVGKVSLVCTM